MQNYLSSFNETYNKHSNDIMSGVMLQIPAVLTFWGSTNSGTCYLYN